MEILAATGVVGEWIWPLIQFVIGLGFVVFVHELGHFAVAKMVGIKVERFALGFGPRLFGFTRGETEYVVNALPLGGYVKMLGQEDFKPEDGGERDPRAFNNKSVGARFAVISAGVIMNVIFAAIMFAVVCMIGMHFVPPIVGTVMPGGSASEAKIAWENAPATQAATQTAAASAPADGLAATGLQPGDKIVRIEGKSFPMSWVTSRVGDFMKILRTTALASPGDEFRLTVQREVGDKVYTGVTNLKTRPLGGASSGRVGFGIGPAQGDQVADSEDRRVLSPFRPGDRLTVIGGAPVEHSWDIAKLARRTEPTPVTVAVQRDGNRAEIEVSPYIELNPEVMFLKDGSTVVATDSDFDANAELVVAKLRGGGTRVFAAADITGGNIRYDAKGPRPGNDLDIVGLIPRTRISSVEIGSPADDAKVRPGDIILEYGDVRAPTRAQILDVDSQAADKGVNITVLRDGNALPPIWVVPKVRNGHAQLGVTTEADLSHMAVASVRPGSPAHNAGLMSGDVVDKLNGQEVRTWQQLFIQLKSLSGKEASLAYRRGELSQIGGLGVVTDKAFDPNIYEINVLGLTVGFKYMETKMVTSNPVSAVAWGVRQTWDLIITTYGTLRQVFAGRVGGKDLMGPVGIGHQVVLAGRRSALDVIYLFALISASLAVVNFLPFPVVDGGIAVLLLIEKVRGRPLPPRAMWVIQVFGLAVILLVFLLLTWNDIAKLIRGLW